MVCLTMPMQTAADDSEASPESNIPADHESDADLEQEFEKNPKRSKKRSKGKRPALKKAKPASAESNSDLVEFLQENQSKDHKLFERLADKEAKTYV